MKKQMKHFAWIACMATAMIGLQSCDNDDKDLAQAPTDIQKAFDTKYPDTRVTEWELDRGEYKADFYYSDATYTGIEATAYFSQSAQWLRTEFEVIGLYHSGKLPENNNQPGSRNGQSGRCGLHRHPGHGVLPGGNRSGTQRPLPENRRRRKHIAVKQNPGYNRDHDFHGLCSFKACTCTSLNYILRQISRFLILY